MRKLICRVKIVFFSFPAIFEVFKAVIMTIEILQDINMCGLIKGDKTYYYNLKNSLRSLETSVSLCEATSRNIPQGFDLNFLS